MKKWAILLLLTMSLNLFAQDKIPVSENDYANQNVEMADTMRSEGKIYVVVSIVGVILIGLFGYTLSIDRKLSKLEKEHGLKNLPK